MQLVEVPESLAAMPPGPGLAAALDALPPGSVPNDRILSVLRAQYRQLCHEQARMAAVLAEVGRCAGHPEPGAVTRLDVLGRYAPEETRAALRWTRRAAECEHDLVETVVHTMPELFAAWLDGRVDRPRVRVFDRYLTGLTGAQVERICRVAVPRAAALTTGQLAVLLRRMVIAVDPEAAARWYRKGVRERNVTAHISADGTVVLSANGLPVDEAEAACVRLQDLAAAAQRAGHPGRIGQIRCDLFLGMLDGRFHHMTSEQVIAALVADYRPAGAAGPAESAGPTDPASPSGSGAPSGPAASAAGPAAPAAPAGPAGPGPAASAGPAAVPGPVAPAPADPEVPDERVGIEVRIGLATLLGRDENPAEIPGLGLLPAPDARHRVALQGRAEWRFAVTDTEGRLLSEGLTRRRPGGIRRDGPPGGIVELHVPLTLLDELTGRGAAGCGGWAEVVADIADRHTRRDAHARDLDSRPGDRLPGAALRRHTEIRDRHCTFIGCRHRAHTAEQDHTHDHRHGGDTVRVNLGPLCGHDHGVKHEGGWRLEQPEPGTFVWHSPLGGCYRTRGAFLLPPMPDPAPVELGPHIDRPTRTVEGPILRPLTARRPREHSPPRHPGDPEDSDPDEPAPF